MYNEMVCITMTVVWTNYTFLLTGEDVVTFLNADSRGIELDHHHTVYGPSYINLAWRVVPKFTNCSIGQILIFGECQQNFPVVNVTTEDVNNLMLPSESFAMSEGLSDVNISTLSNQPGLSCPYFRETLRFNGKNVITRTDAFCQDYFTTRLFIIMKGKGAPRIVTVVLLVHKLVLCRAYLGRA